MGKHLTLDQRITIQVELERNTPIKAIARMIGKAPRTVAREIKQRREARDAKQYGRTNNRCVRRDRCPDWVRCPGEGRCPHFEQERCERVHGSPFVCNGCPKLRSCALTRYLYSARRSDASYRTTLRERREGVNIGPDELKWLDGIVSPGVIKGQSIHHAVWQQRERLPVCERTIYRYFRAGNLFTARRGDLRRACRLKPRKGKRKEHKLDTRCREGRTYELYRRYVEEHPAASVVQMDTVIGRIGGKCLLTLHFVQSCFMVARLLPDHTAKSVNDAIDEVARLLGPRRFRILLAVILTDNGTEFSNPSRIERDGKGRERCRVFYCDPLNTNQKSQCERNHEFIRCVLPKGSSFDALTQADADRVLSHVNSYARPGLGNRRPVDVFEKRFGRVAATLGIVRVAPREVELRPSLLARPTEPGRTPEGGAR